MSKTLIRLTGLLLAVFCAAGVSFGQTYASRQEAVAALKSVLSDNISPNNTGYRPLPFGKNTANPYSTDVFLTAYSRFNPGSAEMPNMRRTYPSPRADKTAEAVQTIRDLAGIARPEQLKVILVPLLHNPYIHERVFIEAEMQLARAALKTEDKKLSAAMQNELKYLYSYPRTLVQGLDEANNKALREEIGSTLASLGAPQTKTPQQMMSKARRTEITDKIITAANYLFVGYSIAGGVRVADMPVAADFTPAPVSAKIIPFNSPRPVIDGANALKIMPEYQPVTNIRPVTNSMPAAMPIQPAPLISQRPQVKPVVIPMPQAATVIAPAKDAEPIYVGDPFKKLTKEERDAKRALEIEIALGNTSLMTPPITQSEIFMLNIGWQQKINLLSKFYNSKNNKTTGTPDWGLPAEKETTFKKIAVPEAQNAPDKSVPSPLKVSGNVIGLIAPDERITGYDIIDAQTKKDISHADMSPGLKNLEFHDLFKDGQFVLFHIKNSAGYTRYLKYPSSILDLKGTESAVRSALFQIYGFSTKHDKVVSYAGGFVYEFNYKGEKFLFGATTAHTIGTVGRELSVYMYDPMLKKTYDYPVKVLAVDKKADISIFKIPRIAMGYSIPLKLAVQGPEKDMSLDYYGFPKGHFMPIKDKKILEGDKYTVSMPYKFPEIDSKGACGGPLLDKEGNVRAMHTGSTEDKVVSFGTNAQNIYRLTRKLFNANNSQQEDESAAVNSESAKKPNGAETPAAEKYDFKTAEQIDTKPVWALKNAEGKITHYIKFAEPEEKQILEKINKLALEKNYKNAAIQIPQLTDIKFSDLPENIRSDITKQYENLKNSYFYTHYISIEDYEPFIMTAVDTRGYSAGDPASAAYAARFEKHPITQIQWLEVVDFFRQLNLNGIEHCDLKFNMFFRPGADGKPVVAVIDFAPAGKEAGNNIDMALLKFIENKLMSKGFKVPDKTSYYKQTNLSKEQLLNQTKISILWLDENNILRQTTEGQVLYINGKKVITSEELSFDRKLRPVVKLHNGNMTEAQYNYNKDGSAVFKVEDEKDFLEDIIPLNLNK
ncbi:MAG: serine protease [Elusimicrobium sp.]|jgi:hypothetical protein|nr:serine protease [Elusimicrobium sp.]